MEKQHSAVRERAGMSLECWRIALRWPEFLLDFVDPLEMRRQNAPSE